MQLFKYVGPDSSRSALKTSGQFTLLFNLPTFYNDPYELFLNTDTPLETAEELAFYECFLRDLPEAPVTCFSRRPDSVVMWAHYCHEGSGVCLVIDEDLLLNQFDTAFIEDVEYSHDPAKISACAVKYACTTKKNRHTEQVMRMAMQAAYFRKRADWTYEQERRLVVPEDTVPKVNGKMLASFPASCLYSVIIGPKARDSLVLHVEEWARNAKVDILRLHYSRRRYQPYFTKGDQTLEWKEDSFVVSPFHCPECLEPLAENVDVCEWCRVSDEEKYFAASSNAFVLLRMHGLTTGVPQPFGHLKPRGRLHSDDNDA